MLTVNIFYFDVSRYKHTILDEIYVRRHCQTSTQQCRLTYGKFSSFCFLCREIQAHISVCFEHIDLHS